MKSMFGKLGSWMGRLVLFIVVLFVFIAFHSG